MAVKVNCLNPIAACGMELLPDTYEITDNYADADAVLVRSASMHDLELSDKLLCVARAGAGVNNIPLDKCAEKGVVVFNTPGANANGVKELVVAGLLLASRDLMGGYNWVKDNASDENLAKAVEKQKKQYAGNEIAGKKLGVIGLGAIGAKVANIAVRLGMEVYGYDPFVSVDAAWGLSKYIKHITNVEDIYKECDYITIHVPALPATKGMLNADAFASGKVAKYVTDFPNPAIAGTENVIALPHLGASTEESEDNCAIMACKEIKDFMENGNIKNSVNYPNVNMGVCGDTARVTICHKNIPNMLTQFTGVFAKQGGNVSGMISQAKGEYAYSILDIDKVPTEDDINALLAIDGVIKVRAI